jgi:hypothetical protein
VKVDFAEKLVVFLKAESRSVLDERALVCGRHIFGSHFPVPCCSTRDARARGGEIELDTQAEIANQLGIQEKTLRKHFREELSSGKFKVDMLADKTLVELMKSETIQALAGTAEQRR